MARLSNIFTVVETKVSPTDSKAKYYAKKLHESYQLSEGVSDKGLSIEKIQNRMFLDAKKFDSLDEALVFLDSIEKEALKENFIKNAIQGAGNFVKKGIGWVKKKITDWWNGPIIMALDKFHASVETAYKGLVGEAVKESLIMEAADPYKPLTDWATGLSSSEMGKKIATFKTSKPGLDEFALIVEKELITAVKSIKTANKITDPKEIDTMVEKFKEVETAIDKIAEKLDAYDKLADASDEVKTAYGTLKTITEKGLQTFIKEINIKTDDLDVEFADVSKITDNADVKAIIDFDISTLESAKEEEEGSNANQAFEKMLAKDSGIINKKFEVGVAGFKKLHFTKDKGKILMHLLDGDVDNVFGIYSTQNQRLLIKLDTTVFKDKIVFDKLAEILTVNTMIDKQDIGMTVTTTGAAIASVSVKGKAESKKQKLDPTTQIIDIKFRGPKVVYNDPDEFDSLLNTDETQPSDWLKTITEASGFAGTITKPILDKLGLDKAKFLKNVSVLYTNYRFKFVDILRGIKSNGGFAPLTENELILFSSRLHLLVGEARDQVSSESLDSQGFDKDKFVAFLAAVHTAALELKDTTDEEGLGVNDAELKKQEQTSKNKELTKKLSVDQKKKLGIQDNSFAELLKEKYPDIWKKILGMASGEADDKLEITKEPTQNVYIALSYVIEEYKNNDGFLKYISEVMKNKTFDEMFVDTNNFVDKIEYIYLAYQSGINGNDLVSLLTLLIKSDALGSITDKAELVELGFLIKPENEYYKVDKSILDGLAGLTGDELANKIGDKQLEKYKQRKIA